MTGVKAVRVNEPDLGGERRRHHGPARKQKNSTMKTLTKLALIAAILGSAVATQAGGVRGYFRGNGTYVAPHYRSDYGSTAVPAVPAYVYRNPYAAEPTVPVREYNRTDGTVVLPHHRTPANDTVTDNLNYRGYGSVGELRYLTGVK